MTDGGPRGGSAAGASLWFWDPAVIYRAAARQEPSHQHLAELVAAEGAGRDGGLIWLAHPLGPGKKSNADGG